VAVIARRQFALDLGEPLVPVGVQFDLGIATAVAAAFGRRISNSTSGFDGFMPR